MKLQTKIQITQHDTKSKLKNTYRIKEIIVKGKKNKYCRKEQILLIFHYDASRPRYNYRLIINLP